MPIGLDHIFVCCATGGPEAAELIALGLTEGSSNTHPGQGTANRRSFFHGGFIELLWVSNPSEAQSELSSRTRLWARWPDRATNACPFGIAFSPSGADVPSPPFATWPYRPAYLPADKPILFAEDTPLREPELFYLAWPNPQASATHQPKVHRTPLLRLRSVSVGLPWQEPLSRAARAAVGAGLLVFHNSAAYESAAYELVINFVSSQAVTFDLRPSLSIFLKGTQ